MFCVVFELDIIIIFSTVIDENRVKSDQEEGEAVVQRCLQDYDHTPSHGHASLGKSENRRGIRAHRLITSDSCLKYGVICKFR